MGNESIAKSNEDPSPNQEQFSREDGEASETLIEDSKETKEEEEEGPRECELCIFIKGGECKESWIEIDQKCVDRPMDNEEGSKCIETRIKFRTCMHDNLDYYEPLIADEAKMIAKMLSEFQVEKEVILAGEAEAIEKAVNKYLRIEDQPILSAEAATIAKAFQELEAGKKEDKADGSKVNK